MLGSFGGGSVPLNVFYIMSGKNDIPLFEEIISFENLLRAFAEFARGKKQKRDVAEFAMHLSGNLVSLHRDLSEGTYRHGGYEYFRVNDPKPRDIHKASVRDRVVHHALYRALYPHFDKHFIHDSYSCRIGKGTHKALRRFEVLARKEGRNHTRTVWALKGDIKKCFASVDHAILKNIISKEVRCEKTRTLIDEVIDSFSSEMGKGIPLGNLTSQLFINMYLNALDQFMKREVKTGHYIRYADDFVVMSHDRARLVDMISCIADFLRENLKFKLHPQKVFIRTVAEGVDFLGWVHFPNHRVLRTSTKQRMFRALERGASKSSIMSYRGLLAHGNGYGLSQDVLKYDHGTPASHTTRS